MPDKIKAVAYTRYEGGDWYDYSSIPVNAIKFNDGSIFDFKVNAWRDTPTTQIAWPEVTFDELFTYTKRLHEQAVSMALKGHTRMRIIPFMRASTELERQVTLQEIWAMCAQIKGQCDHCSSERIKTCNPFSKYK